MKNEIFENNENKGVSGEEGRVGYLVLWLMGAPISLLLLLWVIFGSNLIGAG
jgi:hypothetical protein